VTGRGEDGYQGPATVVVGSSRFEVEVVLRGHFQPIDGRYHWYGRIARCGPLAAAAGPGRARAVIVTRQGRAPCELSEPDPWGRYRVSGISTPPFPVLPVPGEAVPGEAVPGEAADRVRPPGCLPREVTVAVIGAGFGGIGARVRLLQAGHRDFVILERAGAVGGTWRDNSYPGCACDVPSHLYSFSFAPNPGWPASFSRQQEIRSYLEAVTDRFGLRRHLHCDTEVLKARWDSGAALWRVSTSRGHLSARVLVAAAGPLSEPAIPDLPGLDSFPGEVFHSARWNHRAVLDGKRVAVVGTGASAVQIVPEIQPRVSRLVLFQRTPAWVLPRRDRRITGVERWLYRHLPFTQRLARLAIYLSRELLVLGFVYWPGLLRVVQRLAAANLAKSILDLQLRARLAPGYTLGCKRILLSSDFYPALAQPNAEVVAAGLAKVDGSVLIAADGTSREVDVIVFATGFQVLGSPMARRVYRADGTSLARVWGEDMKTLRGTTVPGFPNLLLVIGPNTGLGHSSLVHVIESQLSYILDYLATLDRLGVAALDARPEALERWCAGIERRMPGTVWLSGGCRSWYVNAAGRNPALWPGSTLRFRRATRRVDLAEYRVVPRRR
jgi:cation diffusion facilitator CzcD-associated flavoprotein CzcO